MLSPALPLLSRDISLGRELACVSGVIGRCQDRQC